MQISPHQFSFRRPFDTCDPDDYLIEDGTTHVVWSVGRAEGVEEADEEEVGGGPVVDLMGEGTEHGFARTRMLKVSKTKIKNQIWRHPNTFLFYFDNYDIWHLKETILYSRFLI